MADPRPGAGMERVGHRAARVHRRAIGGVLLTLALAGCGETAAPGDALLEALSAHRGFDARRSPPLEHSPCSAPPRPAITRCGPDIEAADLAKLVLLADGARRRGLGPEAATADRAIAILDVLSSGGTMPALDRALERLSVAAASAPGDPDVENDLAFVRLVRFETGSDVVDGVVALDHIERALARDPRHSAARFNRALALEQLGLWNEALAAWDEFVGSEGSDMWKKEGETRRDRLARAIADRAAGLEVATTDALLRGELTRWARHPAAGSGDSSIPQAAHEAAEWLAERGERTALDAIEAVQTASPRERTELAAGLATYAAARDLWSEGRYEAARERFDEVRSRLEDRLPPLARLAAVRGAGYLVYAGDYEGAVRAYRSVVETVDAARYGETVAHAHWGLGLVAARQGRFERARPHYDVAELLFTRLEQRVHRGSIEFLQAEADYFTGDERAALREVRDALDRFGARGGNMHHNVLLFAGRIMTAEHPAVAVFYHREGLRVAEAVENEQFRVEALIRLAQAERRAGLVDLASRRIRDARRGLSSIPDSGMRRRVAVELIEMTALLGEGLAAEGRIALLDEAIEYYRDEVPLKLPALLERRARARREMGDVERAIADFDETMAIVDRQLLATTDPARRVLLLEASADAADELVELYLDRDQARRALLSFDAARARVIGHGASLSRETFDRLVARLHGETAVLTFAVTPDQTVAWLLRRSRMVTAAIPTDSTVLDDLVVDFRLALRTGASTARVDSLAQRLYGELISPFEKDLAGVRELVVVPDRSLHRLPFAALLGPKSGRRLLERFRLRYAPTIAFALEEHSAPAFDGGTVVAVSGSAFDRRRYPALPPLPHADREVQVVSEAYASQPQLEVVLDRAATPASLVSDLRGASVLHFAGHALFRSDRPDLSRLVLPGGENPALYAGDIAVLDLSGLRLAVLSACDTQAGRSTRSGGLSGLTGSFLAAGASGVIGSLWAVPDAATADLMRELHRNLAKGLHPAEALRRAQSARLADPGHGWGWAAFRYEGR